MRIAAPSSEMRTPKCRLLPSSTIAPSLSRLPVIRPLPQVTADTSYCILSKGELAHDRLHMASIFDHTTCIATVWQHSRAQNFNAAVVFIVMQCMYNIIV